ncbi:MAG: arrestin family protein [Elusimicrobiales bacterium]|nr:arrestin family protein [Elusimicrobiales bacterium]
MSPELVDLLIIGAVIAGALGAAAYFVARFLKGSVKINLPKETFTPGEQVEGAFELTAKKEINANELTAALVARESYHERDYKGRSRRKTREIYRVGQVVEGARVYPAGYTANYNFKIALPAGELRGGVGGSLLGGALNLLGGLGSRIEWSVEVRLDADGVDLASSKRIYVA